ncbi:unnamed protein product [Spirodela intermedia]|uniref:Uncharacterized protein n=1 Tax=Spirodela intermedia TaxID=51605 RepID=A0A7I8JNK0_SPIIN|nr:unnamed protein product [Spirodela intermedia]CAA6671032.1 unnamed protein product [Spirodela intermedia]
MISSRSASNSPTLQPKTFASLTLFSSYSILTMAVLRWNTENRRSSKTFGTSGLRINSYRTRKYHFKYKFPSSHVCLAERGGTETKEGGWRRHSMKRRGGHGLLQLPPHFTLVPVVGYVPLDELLQARLEVRGGLVAQILLCVADVGVGEGHVAVAGHLDDNRDQGGHRHRLGVAQVVDPVRGGLPLLAAAAGALAGGVERGDATLHDVVDVGEVPGQVHPDVAGEGEVGHIRPPPWPVDGEEAEAGDGEPVDVVVRVGDLLAGLLKGHLLVEAIDGTGGGPDHRRLRIGGFAGLQEGDQSGDVAVDVGGRVLNGVADAGLSGEVHDVGEGDDVEELCEQASVVDVALHDEDAVVGEAGLAGLLQGGVVVGVEVVEAHYAIAALLEVDGDVGADEAGGAGDQHGDPAGAIDLGGGADLLLPLDPPPRGGEVPGARGDQEQRPQERRARGSEAPVELPQNASSRERVDGLSLPPPPPPAFFSLYLLSYRGPWFSSRVLLFLSSWGERGPHGWRMVLRFSFYRRGSFFLAPGRDDARLNKSLPLYSRPCTL